MSVFDYTYSEATILKMKKAATNRIFTESTRKKMSENTSGTKNPMYGKKWDETAKRYRKIIQLDLDDNIIKYWNGIRLASRELNINRCTITDVCNFRKKTAGGYKWKYFN